MPLSYVIDEKDLHVQVAGTGAVSMPGMIDIINQVGEDPRFRPAFTVIFDLREARYTAELSDGETLAAVLKHKKDRFQNRFAIVVPKSLHFLAKLYCVLTKTAGFDKIMPFTDIGEAEQWVRAAHSSRDATDRGGSG